MAPASAIAFSPEAEAQLAALYRYLARHASPTIAQRFTEAIVARCESLDQMPRQGAPRDDIRPGLRTLSYRRRVIIAYSVGDASVMIIGIFYGGQNYETLLLDD